MLANFITIGGFVLGGVAGIVITLYLKKLIKRIWKEQARRRKKIANWCKRHQIGNDMRAIFIIICILSILVIFTTLTFIFLLLITPPCFIIYLIIKQKLRKAKKLTQKTYEKYEKGGYDEQILK